VLQELRDAGLEAKPIGEIEIEVSTEENADDAARDLYALVEHMIMSIGAPFVPIKHEGRIYVRPPTN